MEQHEGAKFSTPGLPGHVWQGGETIVERAGGFEYITGKLEVGATAIPEQCIRV